MGCTTLTVSEPAVNIQITDLGFAKKGVTIIDDYLPCNVGFEDIDGLNEAVGVTIQLDSLMFTEKTLRLNFSYTRPGGEQASKQVDFAITPLSGYTQTFIFAVQGKQYKSGTYTGLNATIREL